MLNLGTFMFIHFEIHVIGYSAKTAYTENEANVKDAHIYILVNII